jgi:hypothetical protein
MFLKVAFKKVHFGEYSIAYKVKSSGTTGPFWPILALFMTPT